MCKEPQSLGFRSMKAPRKLEWPCGCWTQSLVSSLVAMAATVIPRLTLHCFIFWKPRHRSFNHPLSFYLPAACHSTHDTFQPEVLLLMCTPPHPPTHAMAREGCRVLSAPHASENERTGWAKTGWSAKRCPFLGQCSGGQTTASGYCSTYTAWGKVLWGVVSVSFANVQAPLTPDPPVCLESSLPREAPKTLKAQTCGVVVSLCVQVAL